MRVRDRTEQLSRLRIHPYVERGSVIPRDVLLIAEFEDGTEYLGRFTNGYTTQGGKRYRLAKRILELEGCDPPKKIQICRHYLYDQTRDMTYSFDLPSPIHLKKGRKS